MAKTTNQIVKSITIQEIGGFFKKNYWIMRLFKCVHIMVLVTIFYSSSIGSAYGENEKTSFNTFCTLTGAILCSDCLLKARI